MVFYTYHLPRLGVACEPKNLNTVYKVKDYISPRTLRIIVNLKRWVDVRKNSNILVSGCLSSLTLYYIFVEGNEEEQYETEADANETFASAIVLSEIVTNRETALSHGINGYISVEPKEPGKKTLDLSDGKEMVLTLLMKLVSYDESLIQATVNIDPENPYTLIVDQGVGNGQFIRFNNFVKYDIVGDVIVKAGERS